MYYIVWTVIYLVLVLLFVVLFKTPRQDDKMRFFQTYKRMNISSRSKKRRQAQKERVKNLSFYQRILYRIWFISVIGLMFIVPVMIELFYYFGTKKICAPADTVFFEVGAWQALVLGIGGFFISVPLMVVYSWMTNRGMIRRADQVFQMGSFQSYPARVNIFISGISGLIRLLLIIPTCYSYRYCTENSVVVKGVFSLHEKSYSYSEVEYVEYHQYTDGSQRYTFVTKDGRKFVCGETVRDDAMNQLLKKKGIRAIST